LTAMWRQLHKGKVPDFCKGRQIKQGDMGLAIGKYRYEEQKLLDANSSGK